METVRLLMVDDSADDRELFARLLRRSVDWHLDFSEAAEGIEAAALLRTNSELDVILLDLKLETNSGLKLLQEWTENYPSLPTVILLTGHGGERVAVEAMKQGAFDCLSKHDCTPEELAHAVWHAALVTRLRRELGHYHGLLGEAERPGTEYHSGETAGVKRAVATFLHELNSPLTGLINYARLLLEEDLAEHVRAILLEMLDACLRIERVLQNMEGLEELRYRPGTGRRGPLDLGS